MFCIITNLFCIIICFFIITNLFSIITNLFLYAQILLQRQSQACTVLLTQFPVQRKNEILKETSHCCKQKYYSLFSNCKFNPHKD